MSHSPCMLPVTSTDFLSLWLTTHSHTVALWLLPSMAFLLQIQSECQSKSPHCSICFSQVLFVCSQLRLSVCRSWWSPVECGKGGGGRQAGLKGGVQFFPHTASTPHWYVTHLTIWGRQSKGHTEIELVTLKTHTHTHTRALHKYNTTSRTD